MPLITVPARSTTGFVMAAGQRVRIVDIEGGQTCDFLAYRLGHAGEHMANGISFDFNGKIAFTTGDVLWSNLGNPMVTIVEDDVGTHDYLYAACSLAMYRRQYGVTGDHPSCTDNLTRELGKLGIAVGSLPTPFNIFMNVKVAANGALSLAPPRSKIGDAIVLRAELPLAVGLSACPAGVCNGGTPKAVAYELLEL